MPPKNFSPMGCLCVKNPDGSYSQLGEIKEINMEPCRDEAFSTEKDLLINTTGEMTIQFQWMPNIQMEYLLIKGKLPANNWLRMHGYPMVRRCGFHRRKHR